MSRGKPVSEGPMKTTTVYVSTAKLRGNHNFTQCCPRERRCCCCLVTTYPTLLQPCGLCPSRLLCPRDPPGKNTGVGCHFLLQGIFPTQRSNPHLLHWQADSSPLSHQWSLRERGVRHKRKMNSTHMDWTYTLCHYNSRFCLKYFIPKKIK